MNMTAEKLVSKALELPRPIRAFVAERINPSLYPCIHNDVRRCMTKTFPFNVLYRIAFDQVIVVAVMHQSKDPDYWRDR